VRAESVAYADPTRRNRVTGVVVPGVEPRATASIPGLEHAFPYRPLWPGLLANTLLYGLAAYGLGKIPSTTLRLRTRNLGLCPKCRYDRSGLTAQTKCPECGTMSAD
jgi:hypothetical protein